MTLYTKLSKAAHLIFNSTEKRCHRKGKKVNWNAQPLTPLTDPHEAGKGATQSTPSLAPYTRTTAGGSGRWLQYRCGG